MERDRVKKNIILMLEKLTDAQLRAVYSVIYHIIKKA